MRLDLHEHMEVRRDLNVERSGHSPKIGNLLQHLAPEKDRQRRNDGLGRPEVPFVDELAVGIANLDQVAWLDGGG